MESSNLFEIFDIQLFGENVQNSIKTSLKLATFNFNKNLND